MSGYFVVVDGDAATTRTVYPDTPVLTVGVRSGFVYVTVSFTRKFPVVVNVWVVVPTAMDVPVVFAVVSPQAYARRENRVESSAAVVTLYVPPRAWFAGSFQAKAYAQ